jgi:hypothetical protein
MGGTTEAYRWAVSLAKREASYGVQVPDADLTKWLEILDADFAKISKEFRTNEQYVNGVRGKTSYQAKSAEGTLKRKFHLSPEVFAWTTALQLGNLTTAGSVDPYTHTEKHPSICTRDLNSFSFIESIECAGLTGTKKLYKGCVIDKQEITINADGEIEHTVDIKTDGSEADKAAFSQPSSVEPVTYLLGSQATVKLNPSAAGDISITSQFQSLKLVISSNVQRRKVSSSSIFAPGYRYAKDSPKLEAELTVSADKSDVIHDYYESDTKLKLQVLIDSGLTPARSIQCVIAECFIMDLEPSADDIEPTLKLKFDMLDLVANSGPVIWTNKTGAAAYLTT